MRSLLLTGLLAALPAVAAPPALTASQIEAAPVYVTRVDGRIVIDTAGRVVRYEPRTALPPPFAERVDTLVRGLRFEPVEVDGRIVNAETDMRVALVAKQLDDGGLQLAIDNVTFPLADAEQRALPSGGRLVRRGVPAYPREALRLGANADLLVAMHFDADGKLKDAAVQQSALVRARGPAREVASVLNLFERAVVQGVKQWAVDPASMPADSRVPDGYVAYVHFSYTVSDSPRPPADPRPGEWTLQTRTVKRVPAWVPALAGAPQPGVADLADGEMGWANRRFRLARPVATGS